MKERLKGDTQYPRGVIPARVAVLTGPTGDAETPRADESSVIRIQFKGGRSLSDVKPAADFLSAPYKLLCNGRQRDAAWNPAHIETIRQQLADFASGTVTEESVLSLAPMLHEFLLPGTCAGFGTDAGSFPDDGSLSIELTADPGSVHLLTNIPWEMVSVAPKLIPGVGQSLFNQTLGRHNIVRSVRGKKPAAVPDAQLRALYCLSNPGYSEVPRFDAEQFDKTLHAVFRQFLVVDTHDLGANHRPFREVLLAAIEHVRPHVFVLVGHGRSHGDVPQLLFDSESAGAAWVPVSELATALARTKRNVLTILICCDLVRQGEARGAQSGALALVREGVPAVIAMQGNVREDVAGAFLKTFLAHLLIRLSVPVAAAAGRSGASTQSLQAFLPTVFLNSKGTMSFFEKTLGSYQMELQHLLQEFPKPEFDLKRSRQEQDLDQALDRSGVVILQGGLGSGRTHLIGQIVHRRITGRTVPPRPILYLACDRVRGQSRQHLALLRLLGHQFEAYKKLLPEGEPLEVDDPEQAAAGIDKKRVAVVLDNFSVGRDPREEKFWRVFFRSASAMKDSLVVVVGEPPRLPAGTPALHTVDVPFFSSDETRRYLEEFVPKLAVSAEKIHRLTGGTPLLLDGWRRFYGHLGDPNEARVALRSHNPRVIADAYIWQIQQADPLSRKELETLCNLCRLPRPTSVTLAGRFLDETGGQQSIAVLLQTGILHTFVQAGHTFCYVPSAKVEAIRRAYEEQVRAAASRVIRRFEAWLRNSQQPVGVLVEVLLRQLGGLSLLQCIQAAYLERKRWDKAAALATLVERAEPRWELYAPLIKEARRRKQMVVLKSAAGLAQITGRQEAADLLKDLEKILKLPSDKAEFLRIKAAFLKDTQQHSALPEIQGYYQEAIDIARKGVDEAVEDPTATKEEWKELLLDLLQDRFTARNFLEHAPIKELANDIEEMESLGGTSLQVAIARCNMAERQLRQEPANVNWDEVGDNLFRAWKVIRRSGDDLQRSYCLYQYAEFLRRKPRPELPEALALYRKAEVRGRLGGDARREGLPLRRRLRLLWARRELSAETACRQIEALLPRLERQRGDSLTMRVLERVCTLRAEIGREVPGDPTDRYLLRACRAAAHPLTGRRRDRDRCGRAFRRYLEYLQERGHSIEAREFITDFEESFETKLEIQVNGKDPWAVCEALVRAYPDVKEE